MRTTKALEFYSGIGRYLAPTPPIFKLLAHSLHKGGLHLALSRSGAKAEVVQAFDWDQTACQVYRANHGDLIRKVS